MMGGRAVLSLAQELVVEMPVVIFGPGVEVPIRNSYPALWISDEDGT